MIKKIVFCFFIFVFSVNIAEAECLDTNKITCGTNQELSCVEDTWTCKTKGSKGIGDTVTLNNPIAGVANDSNGVPDLNSLIGKIINAVLGVVGSLSLAMFVYGGLVWMTAAGGADKVKKGRDILIWATIGLIVIFTAYAMVSFVLTNVIA